MARKTLWCRRKAKKETGENFIESQKEGLLIPNGTVFSTLGDEIENSKQYQSVEDVVITDGRAYVQIEAVEEGTVGITAPRTIVVALSVT